MTRTLSPSRSTEPKALKHGLELIQLGYWIVAIHPETKRPIGKAWGLERWDQKRLRSAFGRYPDAGIGIGLGPGRAPGGGWLIDIEGDGDRAGESLAKLLGGEVPDTPAWSSTRGGHNLFGVDGDRMQRALIAAGAVEGKDESGKGAWHLPEFPGLEFRIGGHKDDGTVKQVQSVIPPTPGTDGKPRAWLSGPKGGIAPLPESAYAALEGLAKPRSRAGRQPAGRQPAAKRGSRTAAAGGYARAALRKECDQVEAEKEGNRNKRLNTAAFSLGQLIGAGQLERVEVERTLLESARRVGLGEGESIATIRSGIDAGILKPRDLNGVGGHRQPPSGNGDGNGHHKGGDDRPVIVVTHEEYQVNDQAIRALSANPGLFQRNFKLISVARDSKPKGGASPRVRRPEGTPIIRPVQAAKLREDLTRVARWREVKKDRNGETRERPAHPPDWSVNAILAREQWPEIRYLAGVVEGPSLRPDGSVIDRPGYDPDTGLLYIPNDSFPKVDREASWEEARIAASDLLDVVKDFPFKEGHGAAWLSGLLTVVARNLIDGPCPLFLFEANASGVGKSLLCDIISIIATGRPMTRTGYYHDPIEMDKQLVATALSGDRVVLFDNLENGGRFGNAALDRALTGRTYRGRLLGRSEMTPPLDLDCVFFGTGNNPILCGDAPRRVIPGRLESPEERPEERDDFSIKVCRCGCNGDLLAHVSLNRAALNVAALTIVRAYILDGKPAQDLTPMDFPEWCGLIRNAVHWATGIDPCSGRKDLEDADPERQHHAALLEGWHEVQTYLNVRGMTAAALLKTLKSPEHAERFETIRSALADIWPRVKPGELPSSGSIGMKIQAIRGMNLRGKRFEHIDVDKRAKVWAVTEVSAVR